MKFSQFVHQVLECGRSLGAKMRAIPENPRGYAARGFVAAKILHLGPTYSDIISSHKANKEWKSCFDVHYPKGL
jgi:hypothetical protein